ncbi:type II secretion system F family protein [Arthrobacter citreus]|jgi:hypothetical protein|uniref:Type II secretion system F family protein n=1 Tax=Arthrobacter citreus TaxID=1670 RepID=A0ABZ2ZXX8_9MICC
MAGILVALFLAAAFGLLLRPLQPQMPGHSADDRAGRTASKVPVPDGAATGIADPALMLDLVAAMLEAGQSLLPALGILADVVDPHTASCLRRVQSALEFGAPWAVAWELAEPRLGADPPGRLPAGYPRPNRAGVKRSPAAELRDALTFVATTGAPSAAVLLATAAQLRRRRSREAERRAAALGVRLVVPLGLCALPAFIVLTVVPLLLSLLPSFP